MKAFHKLKASVLAVKVEVVDYVESLAHFLNLHLDSSAVSLIFGLGAL